jgi:hypothetical protein
MALMDAQTVVMHDAGGLVERSVGGPGETWQRDLAAALCSRGCGSSISTRPSRSDVDLSDSGLPDVPATDTIAPELKGVKSDHENDPAD